MISKRPQSLRSRLLRHVLLPLLFTWALGSVLVLAIANHFVARAFDRSILDDAYVIAAQVSVKNGQLHFQISQTELGALLFDQSEHIYFSLLSNDAKMIAGNAGLVANFVQPNAGFAFADALHQGRAIRQVTLQRNEPQPFTVVVAQTANSRNATLKQLALYSLLPQLLLLFILALWLHRAISKDLKPLNDLEREVEQRDVRDLSPLQLQATTRDVQHLQNALNALLARVAHGVQAQREFAGNVAHELRTPLAGIRALANYGLAHNEPMLWKQQLKEIAQSEARASHMVDQLLALALAQEMGQAVSLNPVRLDILVREVILNFLPRADALQIDLGADGIDQPQMVLGHAALLEGVLHNLIDNAMRYCKPVDAANAIITVAVEADGAGAITLSVADNGQGIEESHLSKLQNRWHQGEYGLQLKQGAGLGLSIVSQYAQLLGASLQMRKGHSPQAWVVELTFKA